MLCDELINLHFVDFETLLTKCYMTARNVCKKV